MIVNTEKPRSDEQPKVLKKRGKRYRCGKKMDRVIDHQLLLDSFKANDCFGRDKKMDKTSDGELLHNNARTRNCANRDKKIERLGDQNPCNFASQKQRVNQLVPIATVPAENLSWTETRGN